MNLINHLLKLSELLADPVIRKAHVIMGHVKRYLLLFKTFPSFLVYTSSSKFGRKTSRHAYRGQPPH